MIVLYITVTLNSRTIELSSKIETIGVLKKLSLVINKANLLCTRLKYLHNNPISHNSNSQIAYDPIYN